MDDLSGSLQSVNIIVLNSNSTHVLPHKQTSNQQINDSKHIKMRMHTFVGSKLTRPQARAATPLQLCEMAKIPTESGPGCQ